MRPTTKIVSRATRLVKFENDAEQRYMVSPALMAWDLGFSKLKPADIDALETFFMTQKGAFDSTWTFPFLGTNYTNMRFDQDDFEAVETSHKRWSTNLRIRQTKQSIAVPSLPMAFPTINGGVRTQFSWTRTTSYRTSRNNMESGLQYAYFHRDNPLLRWIVNYPAITWAEGGTLMDFFVSMGGRYHRFSFVDPETGELVSACRFGSDTFDMQYTGPGTVSVSNLLIEQYFA